MGKFPDCKYNKIDNKNFNYTATKLFKKNC